MKRTIHFILNMLIMFGLFSALFHVHDEEHMSDIEVESPTSNHISQEHSDCLLCTYCYEGIESNRIIDPGKKTYFETLEIPELISLTSGTRAIVSDRAPPFLA